MSPFGCKPCREATDGHTCYLSGSHIHTGVPVKNKKYLIGRKPSYISKFYGRQERGEGRGGEIPGCVKSVYIYISNRQRSDHILLNKILNYRGWGGGKKKNI